MNISWVSSGFSPCITTRLCDGIVKVSGVLCLINTDVGPVGNLVMSYRSLVIYIYIYIIYIYLACSWHEKMWRYTWVFHVDMYRKRWLFNWTYAGINGYSSEHLPRCTVIHINTCLDNTSSALIDHIIVFCQLKGTVIVTSVNMRKEQCT